MQPRVNTDAFDHLVAILQRPELAAALQGDYDERRLKAFKDALRFRPQFCYISNLLPVAAQTTPIQGESSSLNYNTVLTGAITDGEDRRIGFFFDDPDESEPLIKFGNRSDVRLSLDAIAGHNVASAGVAGIVDFTYPFPLMQHKTIGLNVYQDTTPGALELVSTVFLGCRVYSPSAQEALLSPDDEAAVLRYIKARPSPQMRWGIIPVAFDADGNATGETPKTDEPYTILGFKGRPTVPANDFSNVLVNLGFDGGNSFSKEPFPLWALASEATNAQKQYEPLIAPIPVTPQEQLLFTFKNSIDQVNISDNGQLEYAYLTA